MDSASHDMTASDTKPLAKLTTETGQIMVIYERELRVYAKTNSILRVWAIRTGKQDKPTWELEFRLKGEDENAVLVTSLNKPRRFKQVNYLVEYLNELCPTLDEITLGINNSKT